MGNSEDARLAVARLRRFLRARWEEGDQHLFTAKAPPPKPPAARTPASPPAPARQPAPLPRTISTPTMATAPSPARRTQPQPAAKSVNRHPSGILNPHDSDQGRSLLSFYERIKDCTKCPLAKGRNKFVFGSGNPKAEVVFVGEGPGEQEDKQGLPFVGPAGHLLDRLLEAIGIPRDDVFIANVVKCRPPNNRSPQLEEIEECEPYLFEQIKIIRPKVVVALGTYAAQTLLKTTKSIGQLRGRWYKLHDTDFLATYHPAAALRTGEYKKVIERDLVLLKQHLSKLHSDPPADRHASPMP